jgi:hypothetical protein
LQKGSVVLPLFPRDLFQLLSRSWIFELEPEPTCETLYRRFRVCVVQIIAIDYLDEIRKSWPLGIKPLQICFF